MPAPVSNIARSAGRLAAADAASPPPPGFFEGIGAAFEAARNDQPGHINEEAMDAYGKVAEALGDLGFDSTRYINATTRGYGDALNYSMIWADVEAARRRDPKALSDLPATRDEFDAHWREAFRERAERTEQAVSRAGFVAQLAGGFGGAMTDPTNLASMGVGGFGKSILMRVGTEALANGAIEAATQPFINAERARQGRESLTGTQMAFNVGGAALFGGVLRGGIEAAPHVVPQFARMVDVNRARLPKALVDRWDAHLLAKANPLDDPVLLSDLSEAIIGDANLSDLERSAMVVMGREGTADAANPFIGNGAGADMHDALMSEMLRTVLEANPMQSSRAAMATGLERVARRLEMPVEGAVDRFMGRVRGAESSGNDAARNSRSSAEGRYQFTNGTWLAYYKRRYGTGGLSDAQIIAKKGDGNLQDALMRDLTDDNATALTKAGYAANEGNLYLAHFAGEKGARKVLGAEPDTPVEQLLGARAVEANPFLKGMTARDVIAWAHAKMGSSPSAAGLRVRSDIAGGDAEAARIQASLDEAMGRSAALAEEQRRAVNGDANPLAAALEATARPIERVDLPEPAAPLEARAAEADAPRAEVMAILPQLRDVVDGRRQSLNKVGQLADDLGATEQDVRAALSELVREGRLTMNRKTGSFMRKPLLPDVSGPEDVLEFIARNGGIRDDEGHALGLRGVSQRERRELHPAAIKNVLRRRTGGGKRDWQRMTRRNGPLLRHEGRSIDAIGELLDEAGYLHGADGGRPTTAEVLEFLDARVSEGSARYPLGEAAPVRPDDEPMPEGWQDQLDTAPAAINDFDYEAAQIRAATAMRNFGLDPDWVPDDILDEMVRYAAHAPAGMSEDEAFVHALHLMAEDVQTEAFARSSEVDYDFIDYEPPAFALNRPGSENLPTAEDFARWEPAGTDPAQGGISGARVPESAGTTGEQLAALSPEERSPFLDPESTATRSQADSLEHDARAADERAAQFSEVWNDKAFKKSMKAIGTMAHRESQGAADMVAGWRDAETGDVSRIEATVRDLSDSTAYRPYGLNPVQAYIEAFHARVTGDPVEVRAIGGGRVNKEGKRVIDAAQALEEIRAKQAEAANSLAADDAGQMDFAAPTQEQRRTALERQGEGRKKASVAQKAPGSDGGLFDVHAQNTSFRFAEDGEEFSLRDLLGDIDAEAAELKNIRDCL